MNTVKGTLIGVSAPGAKKRCTTRFAPRTSRNISHILRGGHVAFRVPCGPADGGVDLRSVGTVIFSCSNHTKKKKQKTQHNKTTTWQSRMRLIHVSGTCS